MRPTPDLHHAREEAVLAGADSPAAHEMLRRFHALPDGRLALLRQCAAVALGAGCDLYWVGGGVRDLWLGVESLDLDLLIDGDIAACSVALARAFGAELRSYPEFLTAELVAPEGHRVDLAQVRQERYASPAALPQVSPGSLAGDFARRDFTINCLAIPLAPGFGDRLLDPCGGLADLELRRLRTLHTASFEDDPTRIVRGLEFAARFDFELEAATRSQLDRAISNGALALLSGSRLREALARALGRTGTAVRLVRRMREFGVLAALEPALTRAPGVEASIASSLAAFAQAAGRELDSAFRLALLCAGLELEPEARRRLAKCLALSSADRSLLCDGQGQIGRAAERLAANPRASEAHAALAGLSDEELAVLAASGTVERDWVRRELGEMRGMRLRIGGRDLLAAGAAEGAALGRALAATLAARLDGRIPPDDELQFALAEAAGAFTGRRS